MQLLRIKLGMHDLMASQLVCTSQLNPGKHAAWWQK